MSNLALTPQWHTAINQVEKNDVILGGADGNANLATKQLAESLLWLKQNMIAETYKVGDIYMTTINHADGNAVKAHHGYGTWVRYSEGRVPVGFSDNAGDIAEYKTMGNTFGENTHSLTIDEMPSHTHGFDLSIYINGSGYPATNNTDNGPGDMQTASTGGNQPHNNIQPSIVTGYWLRTA